MNLDNIFILLNENEPVDIVYTYVNPYDPKWISKYKSYTNKKLDSTRFDFSDQQILFSLKTIKKYAFWINNIYIVNDDQRFELTDDWLQSKVTFVDHTSIIPSNILPTFNSIVIESFLWNIPNLSNNFLYLNDDMFLGNYIFFNDLIDFLTQKPIQFYNRCRYYNHGWIKNIKQSNELFRQYFPTYQQDLCPQHAPYFLQKNIMQKTYKIFEKELQTMFTKDKTRTYNKYVHNLIFLSAFYSSFTKQALNKRTSFSPIYSLQESFLYQIKNLDKRKKFYCFYSPVKTPEQTQIYNELTKIILE